MAGRGSHHSISRVTHHKDFYLRGGDLTLLVENHIYRIHRYFFERESPFFRKNLPRIGESGSSDSNACVLEDVKSEDFARFLMVFYSPNHLVYEASLEIWLSVIKLAHRWDFATIKELAVRELEKIEIEVVEKISIYRNNGVNPLYIVPSYIAICKRNEPLCLREGMVLGMEMTFRIAEVREALRLQASASSIRTPIFEDFEDTEVEMLVLEIFKLDPHPPPPFSATSLLNGVDFEVTRF